MILLYAGFQSHFFSLQLRLKHGRRDFSDNHVQESSVRLLVMDTMTGLDDPDPEAANDDKSPFQMNVPDTAAKVFELVEKGAGIKSFKLSWDVIRLPNCGLTSAMVVTTNWKFNRGIQQDDLDRLQQAWSANESPKWHPVLARCTWVPKGHRRIF